MTPSMRQYLALFVVGVVATGAALGLLLLSRLVGPDSLIVQRGHVPRPWVALTAWARCRSLRLWSPDPTVEAQLKAHLVGPGGRRLVRAGVSMAVDPAVADVVVTRAGAELSDVDRRRVCSPWSWIRLSDPSDLVELDRAIIDLVRKLRWERDERVTSR